MLVIEAVKESKSYENAGTNLLFKSCKKVNYIYNKHEYLLEDYIEIWKKKIKTITMNREFDRKFWWKIDFNIERIENENEIILKAKSEGIERNLVIEKSKLKEIIKEQIDECDTKEKLIRSITDSLCFVNNNVY